MIICKGQKIIKIPIYHECVISLSKIHDILSVCTDKTKWQRIYINALVFPERIDYQKYKVILLETNEIIDKDMGCRYLGSSGKYHIFLEEINNG